MATATVEIAESLAPEDTPIKLRCASCNKLVLNAFRLPCCDQSICESCQSSLPDTCPVCAHSPLSPDNCKPNKALRLTVKAFLKNEEKKREKERAAALQATEASVQIPTTPTSSNTVSEGSGLVPTATYDPDVTAENDPVLQTCESPGNKPNQTSENTINSPEKEQVVASGASLRSAFGIVESREQIAGEATNSQNDPNESGGNGQENENHSSENHSSQHLGTGDMGYNQIQNGFGNMNWNTGGFNPMMAMQNGMNHGGWNSFNHMMAMPGMSMDSMTMYQGAFGGFNGQAIGMNGINMGMGFNGGFGGGWGMGGLNGDFGANAGYYPGSGYNQQSHQGHFNQMHDQQFQMNNYQNRSYKGGSGFNHQRGRSHNKWSGGQNFDKDNHVRPLQEQNWDSSTPHWSTPAEGEGTKETSSEAKDNPEEALPVAQDEMITETTDENSAQNAPETTSKVEGGSASLAVNANIDSNATNLEDTANGEPFEEVQTPKLKPIASLDTAGLAPTDDDMTPITAMPPSLDVAVPSGPSTTYAAPSSQYSTYFGRGTGRIRGYSRTGFDHGGGYRGRGGYYGNTSKHSVSSAQAHPIEAPGQGVVGAPTGPKAMREGQKMSGFRGRGGLQSRGGYVGSVAPPPLPNASSGALPVAPSRSRSRTRSRSPSRSRRKGSPVYLEQESEVDGNEHRRRHHRSRRGSSDEEDNERTKDEPQFRDDSEGAASRHRTRRHSERHRSSRADREYDRDKERDRKRHKHDHSEDRNGYEDDEHDHRRSSKDRSSHYDRERDHEHREKRSRRKERHRDRKLHSHHDRSRSQSSGRERAGENHASDYEGVQPTSHDPTSRESRSRTNISASNADGKGPPPSAPTGPASARLEAREFKIQGRSKMQPHTRPSISSAISHKSATIHPTPPTAPKSDLNLAKEQVRTEKPYTDEHALEREARNRERLLKEQQRRGLPASSSKRKRSIDMLEGDKNDDFGAGGKGRKTGRISRRVSYQYEGEHEDRAARVEREREAERWR